MGKLLGLLSKKDPKTVEINGVALPAEVMTVAGEIDQFNETLLVIENDTQRQRAGEYLVAIRRQRKRIEEIMKPVIEAAHKAHKAATDARKAFTDELKRQEELLTKALSNYDTRKELAAAKAQAALAEEGVAVVLAATEPKVEGLSSKQDYEAVVEDESLVPITFAGVLLRPVDTAALNKLAKLSNGAPSQIPGVRFQPKKVYSVR